VRSAVQRAETAEKSVLELKAKVSELKVELERLRSESAAAVVALERFEREAKDQDGNVTAAEERAERLAAEVDKLRAEAAKGPVQVERLRREAEREKALRAALDQAQASHAQAEAALAENRQLAKDLAANLQSQEGLIAALTGLQTEVTEQRAWFEAQLATVRETESQQANVVDALQAAIEDRDIELGVLRQQLLDAEAKRAEEAAAFVAALERQ
jgi:chromosome segregation ATPase